MYPSFDRDQVESKLSERKRPWVAKKLLDKTCIILALTLIKSKATEKTCIILASKIICIVECKIVQHVWLGESTCKIENNLHCRMQDCPAISHGETDMGCTCKHL